MNTDLATSRQPPSVPFSDAVERLVLSLSRHWLVALIAYGTFITSLPVLAPVLRAAGYSLAASPIYFAYAFICHQLPERSLYLHGEQMAYCARDLAIFAGAVGVACGYACVRRFTRIAPPRAWLIVLAVIPIGVDGLSQLIGLRESTAMLRIATGLIFSAGMGWYLLPRLDAGFRTLIHDGARRKASLQETEIQFRPPVKVENL